MDNHDYLVDNVNSKSPVDSDHEVRSTQMCSYQQDESTENCSFQQYGACGMRDTAPTDRYVKLLDFTHFSRHMVFSKSERKDKKKAILNGVNVSVVLDLVCATPKKYS